MLGKQSSKFMVYTQKTCTCHADFQPAVGSCKEEGSDVVGICVFKKFLSKFGFIPKRKKKKKNKEEKKGEASGSWKKEK